MPKKLFKIIILLLLPLTLSFTSNAYAGNVNELKDKFTKIFFESSLEYMEAQAFLFEALEMNDEASKTRKSIDFVKNNKKKEGKRLTNAFKTVSENSNAIEGALTKEAATSAEAKVLYAKALPHTVKGVIGTVQLPPEVIDRLFELSSDGLELSVDLHNQTVTDEAGEILSFDIDQGMKTKLLEGQDEISLSLMENEKILLFEQGHKKRQPWLFDRKSG